MDGAEHEHRVDGTMGGEVEPWQQVPQDKSASFARFSIVVIMFVTLSSLAGAMTGPIQPNLELTFFAGSTMCNNNSKTQACVAALARNNYADSLQNSVVSWTNIFTAFFFARVRPARELSDVLSYYALSNTIRPLHT